MILDELAEFCDATDAFGTGVSNLVGDVIDTWANTSGPGSANTLRDLGSGGTVYWVLQVATAYVGGTSVQFQLATDEQADLALSRTNHIDTGAVIIADLVAGYTTVTALPPNKTYERYMGTWVTTVGAVSAGAINSFLTIDVSRWAAYVDNVTP